MPGGDRTGPMGMGPMTGRGAGYCAGYGMPGYMNPMPGRGFYGRGWGRGRGGGGRGWRNMYYATGLPGWARGGYPFWNWGYGGPGVPYMPPEIPKEQEMEALHEQAKFLERSLDEVKKRLGELEASAKKEK
ncbi:MAG: DUF5320 domain-containing protein [bacterium]|nr:MAG: DUF5320 domain-containing protein [bacterium]